ncbi:Homoserine dehydrogenase, partial [Coemansia sp. RSA 921]
ASGYTEPDPRDDLNGMDVARKVTILGRVAGYELSTNTLPVENIVPEELRSVSTADEFMARLPEFDEHFKKLNDEALASGSVLRYVGMVDGVNNQSSVKLARYPLDHPFASLKGSDNIIAFTTERFPNPLIVQGAGAGAAVTAFGIFSDLIKVCERFDVSSAKI